MLELIDKLLNINHLRRIQKSYITHTVKYVRRQSLAPGYGSVVKLAVCQGVAFPAESVACS